MKDLFKHYEEQPEELQEICEHYSIKEQAQGLNYNDCATFQKEVEAIGYTFNYGLDAEPFNLRKLDHEKHEDPFFGELYGDYDKDEINEPF